MENSDSEITLKKISLSSEGQTPIPLPDGKERVALGSGVITKLLGRGGMAAVYEIWNPQLEIYRAVKLINPGSIEVVHQRFQTEIKISAKLSHPNIVEIHGVGEWNGLPYIEMEKIEGKGLDHIIAERGALPAAVCTAVGIMICRALDYAHNQDCTIYGKSYHGVIHRDLKPPNIMVCTIGVVKLMDFGIARPVDVSFQTMDGLVSGTLQYLSPEQLEKKKLDVRTDLYALGVSMYEIVTGVNPFPQTSFGHLVANKTKSKFRPIDGFHIKLNKRLKRVIYKCMQHDPQKRIASASRLLHELEIIHAGLTKKRPEEIMADLINTASDKKVVLASRRHIPWRAIAALLIAGCGAVLFYSHRTAIQSFFKHAEAAPALQKPTEQNPAFSRVPQFTNPQINNKKPSSIDKNAVFKTNAPEKTIPSRPNNRILPGPAREQQTKTVLESLREKYGTDDTIAIMEKEWRTKNFQNVLRIYDGLTAEQAKSGRALILKLRALDGIGIKSALASFLRTVSLNDGEFYLAKAELAYLNRDFEECRKLLGQSLAVPHAMMDYEILKREVFYYTALCSTASFDNDPNERTYKEALDAWWQLRTHLRSNPDHAYNKKAIVEMQRMAIKMQKSPTSGQ
ncbi:MAG: serine/threonine-protein kinase [Chitinivibrionales bacterium]